LRARGAGQFQLFGFDILAGRKPGLTLWS